MKNSFVLFFLFFVSCSALNTRFHEGTTAAQPPSPSKTDQPLSSLSSTETPSAHQTNPPDRIADPDAYYHFVRGYEYELENNFPLAYEEYKAALILDPKSTLLLHDISNIAVRVGDLKSAEEFIQSLLKIEPDQVEALALLGEIYVNQNKIDPAIEVYRRMLNLKPNMEETYFEIASLYTRQKKYPEAEKIISQLITQKPTSSVGYYYMGRLFLEEKKPKEALKEFQEALKRDVVYEPAWMGIGLIYETEGDYKKAVQHYRKFLDMAGPNHREAHYRIIQLLMENRSYQEAKKELEDVLKLDPTDFEANFRLAILYAEQKDFNQAIHLIKDILDHRGYDPRLLDYLGTLYEANKESELAIEAYKQVIVVDRTYSDAYIHLALIYAKLKKLDEAIGVLRNAQTVNPQRKDVFLSAAGWVYLQADHFDESLDAFNQAVKLNPKNPDHYYDLGQAYDKMKRFDEMEKEMKTAIEIDPDHANALNYLGYSYADKNIKLKEARELIKRALKIRPNDGFIIDSLGWVAYQEGNFDEAITELKRAITFVSDDSTIHQHLGEAYLKKDLKKEAKEELLRSLEIDPTNQKLIDLYKDSGLGDPRSEERFQKALKKVNPDNSNTNNNPATQPDKIDSNSKI